MKTNEELAARVEALEKALRGAAEWLRAGEGISLLYYWDFSDDVESQNLIREVCKGL